MKSGVEKFESGWVGLTFALGPDEIDRMIGLLGDLKKGQLGHFHFRCDDLSGTEGIADVEFSVKGAEEVDNLTVG